MRYLGRKIEYRLMYEDVYECQQLSNPSTFGRQFSLLPENCSKPPHFGCDENGCEDSMDVAPDSCEIRLFLRLSILFISNSRSL